MLQYLLRFPLWALVILIRYPLAIWAVWKYSSEDKKTLVKWKWLETIDNDLTGDSGWKSEHLSGSDPLSSKNRIRWLWRNGGNQFNYYTIGVPFKPRPNWAFWFKITIPLFMGRFLDCRFGWSDYHLQGRCKYVFTIRVKTKP